MIFWFAFGSSWYSQRHKQNPQYNPTFYDLFYLLYLNCDHFCVRIFLEDFSDWQKIGIKLQVSLISLRHKEPLKCSMAWFWTGCYFQILFPQNETTAPIVTFITQSDANIAAYFWVGVWHLGYTRPLRWQDMWWEEKLRCKITPGQNIPPSRALPCLELCAVDAHLLRASMAAAALPACLSVPLSVGFIGSGSCPSIGTPNPCNVDL